MIIILIGFVLRLILSIYNISYEYLPGASFDAVKFHNEGQWFKHYLETGEYIGRYEPPEDGGYVYRVGWIFGVYLGYLYFLFGTSHLMTSIISVFVWLMSALILKNILERIKTNKFNINLALFLYTFAFPTAIIYSLITLREPYMLFIINLIILQIIILKDQKNYFKIFTKLIFISLLFFTLAILHRSNIFFVILFLVSLISYFFIKKFDLNRNFLFILFIIFILFFYNFGYMEKVYDAIITYQIGHFNLLKLDRASYYLIDKFTNSQFSFINFFTLIIENFINYFIQPTLFKINDPKDLILAYENLIRLFMLFYVIKKIYSPKENKNILIIFLMMYFISEFPYSQASVNWGTTSRHHFQLLGLLLVMFFYPKKKKLKYEKKNNFSS